MGFLSPADAAVARAAALAMLPPPPPDITAWCEANIAFDERSPMPGPFRIARFPFLKEIHEVLSPEHAAREVTVMGSAQWGKTVSIIQPVIGAWHAYAALDSLVVHPTGTSAKEWVNNKWLPMRRQTAALRAIFGDGRGENNDAMFNQETLDRNGSLKVASAGSPADLTGTSRRLVIMDDVAKYDSSEKGDPEALAVSRADAFEDAKILRVSTPQVKGTCRISRAFDRSDQRVYEVPCPHCGVFAALTWENFRKSIQPERLAAAHFTCDACGCAIGHADKERIVGQGRWRATNPRGDHPGFFLWRAYAPQRDWASIAVAYAQVMGWTRAGSVDTGAEILAPAPEAETEQVFWNDVLGLPFAQATGGPDWEALRNRAEHPDAGALPVGRLPATGFILAAGVDCQLDRTEVQIVAFGRNYRRWAVDYRVIPHHIGDAEGRAALNALLKTTWKTENGLRVALDMMAIDAGTYTEDVWSFGKTHPWNRVILVKGSSSASGPVIAPMKFERRLDGTAKRAQKRAFLVNVSQMKADFYGWLAKDDPAARGFVGFAAGLGDEYYRQITSEVCVLKKAGSGVMTRVWETVEATRRNEGLDTMNYAEAAARRKGWTSLTDEQWDLLEAERSAAPPEDEPDLFDAALPVVQSAPRPAADGPRDAPAADTGWLGIDRRKSWLNR